MYWWFPLNVYGFSFLQKNEAHTQCPETFVHISSQIKAASTVIVSKKTVMQQIEWHKQTTVFMTILNWFSLKVYKILMDYYWSFVQKNFKSQIFQESLVLIFWQNVLCILQVKYSH